MGRVLALTFWSEEPSHNALRTVLAFLVILAGRGKHRVVQMAQDSSRRLLLCAVIDGLAYAIRRNDASVADRYRRRLRLVVEQFEANPPVREALDLLLLVSGQWLAADAIIRDESKEQIFDLSRHVLRLLWPPAAG